MEDPVHFAAATGADLEILAEFIQRFYNEDPNLPMLTTEKARIGAAAVVAPVNQVEPLLIFKSGRPIGYALLVSYYSNEYGGCIAVLDEFFIAPEYRGRGMGGKALEMLKTWAVDNYRSGITLEITGTESKARSLYERHGFSVTPRRIMAWFPEKL